MTRNAEPRDIADSSDARTAQFTLISILLGIILAALVDGLPHGAATYALTVLDPTIGNVGIDVRVTVVLLMAVLLWLEYTWSVLTRLTSATPGHNLTYFMLAIVTSGVALSVSDFRAWMAWIFALSVAAILSGIVNHPRPTDPVIENVYRTKLQWVDRCELGAYLTVGIGAGVVTCFDYWPNLAVPPFALQIALCLGILAVVVADVVIQVVIFIPALRTASAQSQGVDSIQDDEPVAPVEAPDKMR